MSIVAGKRQNIRVHYDWMNFLTLSNIISESKETNNEKQDYEEE